jgi:hypothetical protein
MTSSQITENIFIAYDAYATLCGYFSARMLQFGMPRIPSQAAKGSKG